MKRKAIGAGAYVDEQGRYWERPGGKTWRLLRQVETKREAIRVASARNLHAVSSRRFADLAQRWMDAGYPGKRGKLLDQFQIAAATARAKNVIAFFGKMRADEIRLVHLPQYAEWRRKKLVRSQDGGRTVDMDLVTLSNILRFGVFQGILDFNYIRADRPKYQENIRHAREVMPESAEIIHAIASELLETVISEVMAWQCFFAEFTGCRTSELLRLRRDAKNKTEAGFIEWLTEAEKKDRSDDTLGHLYLGRRSKNGMNPWAQIGPEFAEMLKAFENWHTTRFVQSDTPWFFPGKSASAPIVAGSFGHALKKTTTQLKLPHITPHGFRAFYATKRLRDGARPVDIAAEMGDKTVALIETIYADNPGGKKLWWTPADGLPAWQKWSICQKVDSGLTLEEKRLSAESQKAL